MHFEAHDVDWLVLEAGLGGRLDATTAHPKRPLIAVGVDWHRSPRTSRKHADGH